MEKIGKAILTIFDNLESDDQSSEILDLIDGGETDEEIKDGIRKGVIRLKEIGKTEIAEEIEQQTKGFAF
jgi:hypothetical protein